MSHSACESRSALSRSPDEERNIYVRGQAPVEESTPIEDTNVHDGASVRTPGQDRELKRRAHIHFSVRLY